MFEKISYKKNRLVFDGVKIDDIIKNYETPVFIYSKSRLEENFYEYYKSFQKNNIENYNIAYALKANDNINILKLMCSLGAGADTVSGAEIEKAIMAGILPEKIIYSGVGKTTEELKYAIGIGVGQINMESKEEFENIKKIAENLNKKANISIRINPDIDADTHDKTTTGKKDNKFGIDFETSKKIIENTKTNKLLNFKGLSVHIGSPIYNINKFELVFKYLAEIYKEYPEFTTVDLGGGASIQYKENEVQTSKGEYVELIAKYFGKSNLQIIIEPGRSIVGDACIFLTKISYVKRTSTKNFIIVDGGMNNLVRPAMYDAYHHPLLDPKGEGKKEFYDIVGPICESSDIFVKGIESDGVDENSKYVAFLSSGAYGRSMSSGYNSHNIAGELLIDDGKVREIRKPITFRDMLIFENC